MYFVVSILTPPSPFLTFISSPTSSFLLFDIFRKGNWQDGDCFSLFHCPHGSFRNNACILHSKHDEEGYIYPNMYIYIYVLLHGHTKKIKPQWEESNDRVEKNNKNRGMKEKKKVDKKDTEKDEKSLRILD